ncbi:2-dehydropantoate 2-reductase [hydrothermal vent metagenome]|uniref:2-dehydropantoate 2-reductase n=1 Tax=hydrothermal vent metagenome TaxID=652676 RepID=A0A3B1C339_9ZZZZ
MKFVIVGAGGVGGYYGAMLARGGHEVFFTARGEHLKKIGDDGLEIKSVNGDFGIRAMAGESADSFGLADYALVCVKSYDTASTFDLYKNNVGRDTVILSLQNGVDNEDIISSEFGRKKVMGGVAFIGSRIKEPGVILHTAFGHITIGDPGGGVSERALKLCQIFNGSGVKCHVSDDIKRDLWGKMVWNTGFNAICAILDCSAKEVVSYKGTRQIVKSAMDEWIEVARSSGVNLAPSLADKNIAITLKGGEVIPSMLHDRRRGKKMEIETFNGKAAKLGAKLGIDTPVNLALAEIIRFFNQKL